MKVFIYSTNDEDPMNVVIGFYNAFIASMFIYTIVGAVIFLASKI